MQRFPTFATLLLASFAAGCGGGSSSVDSGSGTLSLALTDDVADELTQFEVDVRSVELTRPSGVAISVMPRSTRVDFVQLEALNELVAAVDLPAGVYTGLRLTLDFADAEVLLVGQTGPATVRDRSGAAITGAIEVEIELATRFVVRGARNNLCLLDLDLAQSLVVDSAANAVTFTPVWSAELDPSNPWPIATTGQLQSIDIAARTFAVERRNPAGEIVDTFTVLTDATTIFQIDGVVQVGGIGLGNLTGSIGRRLFVQGTFDGDAARLRAAAVEAGAGVPGNGQDWVLGHVTARSGGAGAAPTLTVLGRSFDADTGARAWNTIHTVAVSTTGTKVLRRAMGGALGADDINIGQLVWVFGEMNGTSLDAQADDGVVRLLRTGILGIAAGPAAAGVLTVDVRRIDRLPTSLFDFTVSGQPQADPAAFAIDLGSLNASGIGADSRVRAFVWMNAVGSTGPDAEASTLIDRTSLGRVLACLWTPAQANALANFGSSIGIYIATADIAAVADGITRTPLNPTPTPQLQGLGIGGFYRIVENRRLVVYRDFATFQAAVLARAAGASVLTVTAAGRFDAGTQTFAATTATIVFD
jgi:hypothetical protein